MARKENADRRKTRLLESVKFLVLGLLVGVVLSSVFALAMNGGADRDRVHITDIDPEAGASREQEVTIEYIEKKLTNLSDLSTARMTYAGLYTVTEGRIPFLTQKGFSMAYTAEVRAGIDVSQMTVAVEKRRVTVTLPPAELQVIRVDPDSIQFYDEKHALFNWDKKTDVTQAIAVAEEEAGARADTDGLLRQAAQNAEYVVRGILEGSIEDRQLVVKQK